MMAESAVFLRDLDPGDQLHWIIYMGFWHDEYTWIDEAVWID